MKASAVLNDKDGWTAAGRCRREEESTNQMESINKWNWIWWIQLNGLVEWNLIVDEPAILYWFGFVVCCLLIGWVMGGGTANGSAQRRQTQQHNKFINQLKKKRENKAGLARSGLGERSKDKWNLFCLDLWSRGSSSFNTFLQSSSIPIAEEKKCFHYVGEEILIIITVIGRYKDSMHLQG